MEAISKAIVHEAELRKDYISGPVETIYFGGGTPSLLPIEDLSAQIRTLKTLFNVDPNAEITLESNPDDITAEKLAGWKKAGVNRLSIGIQSFFEDDLQWMNRAHNATLAEACIHLAHEAGFDNLTIDLIYGTPTLTDEQWKHNVYKALSLGITHLSCYALTVEPKTALADMIRKHKIEDVSADKQGHHFELLMQWMKDAGWEHYEISNFAKPGHRSRHNSSYWKGASYLGLGPSAHSFNGASRQWNIANNALYLKSIEQGVVPFEVEQLTPVQQLNEYIMTSLRTMEGFYIPYVQQHWSETQIAEILNDAEKFIQYRLMVREGDYLRLTEKGKLMADGIAADLFR